MRSGAGTMEPTLALCHTLFGGWWVVVVYADGGATAIRSTMIPRAGGMVGRVHILTRVATYAALVTLYARTNRNALSSNPRGVTAWIDFGIKTWI